MVRVRKKSNSRRQTGSNRHKLKYVLPVLFIFAVVVAMSGQLQSLYIGGWEVQNYITEVRVNGITYTEQNQPETMISSWSAKSLYFDVDHATQGAPNTQIEITDPIAVTQIVGAGDEWFPSDGEPWKEYSKTIGNDTYFWDHWVYTFWVTVNGIPDVYHAGTLSQIEAKQAPLNAAGWGIDTDVAVKVAFQTNFWETNVVSTFTVENATYNYVNASAWGGIMGAYIIDNDAGMIGDVTDPLTFSGFSAGAPMGGSVGLFTGATSTEVNETIGVEGSLAGVPESIELEVYGNVFPGFQWPVGGSITSFPAYFKYQLRVDVLTTAGYEIIDGTPPENPIDPDIIDLGADPIGVIRDILMDAIMGPIVIIMVIVILLVCVMGSRKASGGAVVIAAG